MINIDDRFMNFQVGWIVSYKDGTSIYEGEKKWSEVPKVGIDSLSLKWYDKMWNIAGKENYIQFKRGYVVFSPSGNSSTEPVLSEMCIGYYDENGKKVIYKVNSMTGEMRMEVKEG